MTAYAQFRLRIERGPSRRTYRVEASGLGGEEEGRFKVPFTDTELENFILKVGRTRRGVRRFKARSSDDGLIACALIDTIRGNCNGSIRSSWVVGG